MAKRGIWLRSRRVVAGVVGALLAIGLWQVPASAVSSAPPIYGQTAWSGAWAQVVAGFDTTCGIDTTGRAYCWGNNNAGTLGDGSSAPFSELPVPVDTSGVLAGKRIVAISPGPEHTCALDSAGLAYCWGYNGWGGLGNNTRVSSTVPVAVATGTVLAGKVLTQIVVGYEYTCALDSTGKAYCWGLGGELGTATTAQYKKVPVAVNRAGALAGKVLTQIGTSTYGGTGPGTTCVLSAKGIPFCWPLTSALPAPLITTGPLLGTALRQVVLGAGWFCALTTANLAYCWGDNSSGQLGDGTSINRISPTPVITTGVLAGKVLTRISAGGRHTCLLDSTGTAYCFGSDYLGQLGDGANNTVSGPVAVNRTGALKGKTLTTISTGLAHTCALDTSGEAYCWGSNGEGSLGIGTRTDSNVPVAVLPPT